MTDEVLREEPRLPAFKIVTHVGVRKTCGRNATYLRGLFVDCLQIHLCKTRDFFCKLGEIDNACCSRS
jgi:hypothetical protein